LYNIGGDTAKKKFFDLKIIGPPSGSKDPPKLKWNPVIPEEYQGNVFTIEPKKATLKGRKTGINTVKFYSEEVAKYDFVLIATPSLANPEDK